MKRRSSSLARFWVHPVTVETYLGQATDGADSYADPVAVTGYLEDGVKWVRGTDGAEVVSSSTLYAPIESADTFTPGTRVTRPGSTEPTRVLTVSRFTGSGLPLPDHVVIALA